MATTNADSRVLDQALRASLEPGSTSGSAATYLSASCPELTEELVGPANTTQPAPPPSSVYPSQRIQSMIESREDFETALEFDIAASKVHWSELDPTPTIPQLVAQDEDEAIRLASDCEDFETLRKDPKWGTYLKSLDELKLSLGEELFEGGQARIYEVRFGVPSPIGDKLVAKVMKGGSPLRALQQQWPLGMLTYSRSEVDGDDSPLWTTGMGCLVRDKNSNPRFAFLMERVAGDLRTLINLRMVHSKNGGPPFGMYHTLRFMKKIARDMRVLHDGHNVLHRDLKAANVLVGRGKKHGYNSWRLHYNFDDWDPNEEFRIGVADFECSVGVIGTRFWRAPEILQQLRNGIGSTNVEFTRAGDVYSYGMTCYEIITGCIPFENHIDSDYDVVISGKRPELPPGLDPILENIVTSCWHSDPLQRPTFETILSWLKNWEK